MSSVAAGTIIDQRTISAREMGALLDWAVSVRVEDVPDDAKRRAVLVLFDDIAAMVGAAAEPEFQRVLPRLGAPGGPAESTVFSTPGRRTDRRSAAQINAVAANWLELDEGYRVTPCHAGLYLLPALLADAEALGTRFADLLRAIAVGYEVITRVARAFAQQPSVMQSHGRFAAVGAAAAVALNRQLKADQAMAALSSAVTLITPSPRNHLALGALVRNLWAAVGAESGIRAVDWADVGITGSPGGFHDVYCTVLRGRFEEGVLSGGLGGRWAILDGYTKMYACCQHLHAAVEAVLELHGAALAKGLSTIVGIDVATHDLALPLQNAQPHNTLAAKFSMAHALAAALVTGEAGAPAFSSSSIGDARVDALRQKVAMGPWPGSPAAPPNDRPAQVRIRFADGSSLEATCFSARGGADRPFPDAARIEKIAGLTAAQYPRLGHVAEALVGLPEKQMQRRWRDIVRDFSAG
jgi:2-methylcitrate dehydratase PrpD